MFSALYLFVYILPYIAHVLGPDQATLDNWILHLFCWAKNVRLLLRNQSLDSWTSPDLPNCSAALDIKPWCALTTLTLQPSLQCFVLLLHPPYSGVSALLLHWLTFLLHLEPSLVRCKESERIPQEIFSSAKHLLANDRGLRRAIRGDKGLSNRSSNKPGGFH